MPSVGICLSDKWSWRLQLPLRSVKRIACDTLHIASPKLGCLLFEASAIEFVPRISDEATLPNFSEPDPNDGSRKRHWPNSRRLAEQSDPTQARSEWLASANGHSGVGLHLLVGPRGPDGCRLTAPQCSGLLYMPFRDSEQDEGRMSDPQAQRFSLLHQHPRGTGGKVDRSCHPWPKTSLPRPRATLCDATTLFLKAARVFARARRFESVTAARDSRTRGTRWTGGLWASKFLGSASPGSVQARCVTIKKRATNLEF